MERVVVIGAGHAGVELANALRHSGFLGAIVLVNDEADLPYQKPPLSKDFLRGDGRNPLMLKAEVFYTQNSITLLRGRRVVAIDRAAKLVHLDDGESLSYDHLALALGARNRRLAVPGADHPEIFELRTLADTRRILARLPAMQHAAIIGGGFIGLEIAACLREKRISVDIVEIADCLMGRAVSAPISSYFLRLHEAMGAAVHFQANVVCIDHQTAGVRLGLAGGEELQADALLIAAGIVPNTEIAAEAGLATGNGILVDDRLLTSDPAISALGDCVAFPCLYTGDVTRLESVQNAVDQARCIARRLTGNPQPYNSLPWFWSNQGKAKLQIAGLATGHDRTVVRGNPDSDKFSVFLYRGEKLLAVESVNAPADHLAARKLIEKGVPVPPELAARADTDLKALAA